MYYPYLRGKQFELIMLRELASRIGEWGFVPIIEPVKKNFAPLKRAIASLVEHGCEFVLISNPEVGDLSDDQSTLWAEIIQGSLSDYDNYSVGLSLSSSSSLEDASSFFQVHNIPTTIIHDGFSDGKGLATVISELSPQISEHIFMHQSSTLYRKHFSGTTRVLITDGFTLRPNKEYPITEPFSELYLTYEEVACDGFGDYLIAGNGYRDGGGPAGAVAIHITYVDSAADDAIAINHFISDMTDVLDDIAEKFAEALSKLVEAVSMDASQIYRSEAIEEFIDLHERGHYPGLGYVKKLSMKHHVELMAHLLIDKG